MWRDLRVLYSLNTKRADLSVGEFAKKATTSKLYHDKLKQVLITKYHLNNLLLSGLPTSTTLVPFLQIMGSVCQVYVLWPTLYVPENAQENRLMLRALPWDATYVVTIQLHITNTSA